MTLFEAYRNALDKLGGCGIENAPYDAKELLLSAFGITHEQYAAYKNEPCSQARLKHFDEFVERRAKREPLQYILGTWEFCGYDFYVAPGCLIPRPETEIIVNAALSLCPHDVRFVDMCSGSGCIGISYAMQSSGSVGELLDVSESAIAISRENIKRIGVPEGRLSAKKFDLFTDSLEPDVALLMSNPPYISAYDMRTLAPELSYEPSIALFGGTDGLDFYRAIAEKHIRLLTRGAYAVIEIGVGQASQVCELLRLAGAKVIDVIKDDNGIDRTVVAEKR